MERALMELVWERAGRRCEYCQMPQEYDDTTFEVDHVVATSHGGPPGPRTCVWPASAATRSRAPTCPASIRRRKRSFNCLTPAGTPGRGTSAGTAHGWWAGRRRAAPPSPRCGSTSTTESPIDRNSSTKACSRRRPDEAVRIDRGRVASRPRRYLAHTDRTSATRNSRTASLPVSTSTPRPLPSSNALFETATTPSLANTSIDPRSTSTRS